jgi:hypothetical protein
VSQKRIRAAYESRLATWAAARSTPLRVAWENAVFVPAAGETYLRANLLPADTAGLDLAGAVTTWRGVFQVLVVAPVGVGSGAAAGIADEVAAQFTNNLRLTVSGLTVQQITPPRIAPALSGESTYTIPVSWQYRADA